MTFESSASTGGARRANSVGRLDKFYPSPFFDVARNYMPGTLKELFGWCLYYQLTNPVINAVTTKLSTYAITDMLYEDANPGAVEQARDLFENIIDMRNFCIEFNLDRYTFGNAFASVFLPFKKHLVCEGCKASKAIDKSKYIWRNFAFNVLCEGCGHSGPAKVVEQPIKSKLDIRMIRWNPSNITIKSTEVIGANEYYYNIPRGLRNDIVIGKPEIIERIPQAFIEAIKKNKSVRIANNKIFHSKRPSPSRDPSDNGWGVPLILPVLKDAFLLQVLRKSQEAVALEQIVPMRILFPQITTDGSNVYNNINLKDWQREVMSQVEMWRQDFNHVAVMPVPVGNQNLGGQGRAMLLHQEIRVYSEQMIAGMGIPTGFFYGEAMFSGASVNMRALENEFIGNRQDLVKLVQFVQQEIYGFMGWKKCKLNFKPFRMADDLQRAAFEQQLVAANSLSEKTFAESRDFNFEHEQSQIDTELKMKGERMRQQTIAQAKATGEAQVVATGYQTQANNILQAAQQSAQAAGQPPMDPNQAGGDPNQQGGAPPADGALNQMQSPMNSGVAQSGGNNVGLDAQAESLANELAGMEKIERYSALSRMRRDNPGLYTLVNQKVNSMRDDGGSSPMRPLPAIVQ